MGCCGSSSSFWMPSAFMLIMISSLPEGVSLVSRIEEGREWEASCDMESRMGDVCLMLAV